MYNLSIFTFFAGLLIMIFYFIISLLSILLSHLVSLIFIYYLLLPRYLFIICNKILYLQFTEEQYLECDSVERGLAAMPFCSLFNHSCSPNIMRISRPQHIILYALYPIRKNEQVLNILIYQKLIFYNNNFL